MPIVSKRRWQSQMMNPLATPRPDVKLLLCAMSLLAWSPNQQGARSTARTVEYMSLKRALLDAEMAGLLTVPLLQTTVLISLYEVGHAIYPAAYMSIGSCVRLGLALDLEKQCQKGVHSTPNDLEEEEERRRVWWAIVILDRYENPAPFDLNRISTHSAVDMPRKFLQRVPSSAVSRLLTPQQDSPTKDSSKSRAAPFRSATLGGPRLG